MLVKKQVKWFCALLACLLVILPNGARAAVGDPVRCVVTSEKATLYRDMNREEPLLLYYREGAAFFARETGDDAWLWVETQYAGNAYSGYVSILDVAVEYSGEDPTGEEAVGRGLGEGGVMPPDDLPSGSALPLNGVMQNFRARTEKVHIYAQPDTEAEVLGYYGQGSKFSGVLAEEDAWVQVVVDAHGEEVYGYVPYGRNTVKSTETIEKKSDTVTVRITSGVITVYAKPSKDAQQIGVVSAPVRFSGQKTKSGKWVRVELDGKDWPQYGYIEARYIEKAK